jgi:hypothetical protein
LTTLDVGDSFVQDHVNVLAYLFYHIDTSPATTNKAANQLQELLSILKEGRLDDARQHLRALQDEFQVRLQPSS